MQKIKNVNQEKVMDFLNRLDFFKNFTDHEKKQVVEFHTHCFMFKKGEHIIKEGDYDSSFYILLSGNVSVSKNTRDLPIAKLEPGEFFGEVSFLTNGPRTSNVIADEVIIVIKVSKTMLNKLSAEIREKFKDKIIEKLVKRLNQMNDAFTSLFY